MNTLRDIRINFLGSSVLSIVLGIVFVAWPGAVKDTLVYIVAAIILAVGVLMILAFVKAGGWTLGGTFDLLAGIALVALAVAMASGPQRFLSTVLRIVGFYITVNGLMALGQSGTLKGATYSFWKVSLGFALVTTILGLLILIAPNFAGNFAVRIIGAILIYNGISNVWISSRVHKAGKGRYEKKEIIDVEAVEIKDNSKR